MAPLVNSRGGSGETPEVLSVERLMDEGETGRHDSLVRRLARRRVEREDVDSDPLDPAAVLWDCVLRLVPPTEPVVVGVNTPLAMPADIVRAAPEEPLTNGAGATASACLAGRTWRFFAGFFFARPRADLTGSTT